MWRCDGGFSVIWPINKIFRKKTTSNNVADIFAVINQTRDLDSAANILWYMPLFFDAMPIAVAWELCAAHRPSQTAEPLNRPAWGSRL